MYFTDVNHIMPSSDMACPGGGMSNVHCLIRRGCIKYCGDGNGPAVNLLRKFFHNKAEEIDAQGEKVFLETCETDGHGSAVGRSVYCTGNEKVRRLQSQRTFLRVMKHPVEFPKNSDFTEEERAMKIKNIIKFPRVARELPKGKNEVDTDSDNDWEQPLSEPDEEESGQICLYDPSIARSILKGKMMRSMNKAKTFERMKKIRGGIPRAINGRT